MEPIRSAVDACVDPVRRAASACGEPLRLVEREADSDDEEPKALACYGVYLPMTCLNEEEKRLLEEENLEETWRKTLKRP